MTSHQNVERKTPRVDIFLNNLLRTHNHNDTYFTLIAKEDMIGNPEAHILKEI